MNASGENPRIDIELLALDLRACGRCTRTAGNLDDALDEVARTLGAADVEVTVTRTVVRSLEEAERLRFASSPTIRMNGRDIAPELRESACSDCGVDCRVWMWRGREHDEAPRALIVDALLRAYGEAGVVRPAPAEYRVPENLRRLFSGTKAASCCDASGAAKPDQPCGCGR